MTISLEEALFRSAATSREIQARTGLTQTAVSRQLRDMGERIVRLKTGRSVKYALTKNAFGGDDHLPLYQVDSNGSKLAIADIRPLAHGGFYIAPFSGCPKAILGEDGTGIYDDLPYFLDDLRPQGFLGGQIALALSSQSDDFPSDPRRWNADHVGRYLLSNGDDLPGNLKLGRQTNLRIQRKSISHSRDEYPALADNVLNGMLPGSSAGGEQPKFTAYCAETSTHVIVKFSPRGNGEIARRWKDILITEYYAAEILNRWGHPASKVRLISADDRLFLEAQRFDRHGEYGRSPMISLLAVDAEFVGLGSHWPSVTHALYKRQLMSWQHVIDTEVLWAFGKLINNTDMHLGNISLAMDDDDFKLLPVYDMCSMGFAPKSAEVSDYRFAAGEFKTANLNVKVWDSVCEMACEFWGLVARDERISDELRGFLRRGNPMDGLGS